MNKKMAIIVLIILGTLATIPTLSCKSQNTISVSEYLITTSDSFIQGISITDGFICWEDGDVNTDTYRIMARELATKTEFVIDPFDKGHLVWKADEGYVIWMRNPEEFSSHFENMWVYDLRNREKFQIPLLAGTLVRDA
jgi:hypothetical protein